MASFYIDLPQEGSPSWRDPVANAGLLPASGNNLGDARVVQNTGAIYVWTGAAWVLPAEGPSTLTNSHIFVGSAGNVATDVAMTGNVTISNTGVTTIGAAQVTDAMLASTYALLAGRAGGQTLNGGTAASDNLNLISTANATKGKIFLGTASAYDQTNDLLGLGITSPTGVAGTHLHLHSAAANPGSLIHFTNNASGSANTQGVMMGFHQNSSVFSIDQLTANKVWLKIQGTFAFGIDESRQYGNSGGGSFTAGFDHTGTVRFRSITSGLLFADNQGNISASASLPLSVANGGTGQTNGTLKDSNFITPTTSVDFYNRQLAASDGIGGTVLKLDWSGADMAASANLSFNESFGLKMSTAGGDAIAGTVNLAAGTATVNTTSVHNTSLIFITAQNPLLAAQYVTNIVDGTSFDIKSLSVLDTSTVAWFIVNTM